MGTFTESEQRFMDQESGRRLDHHEEQRPPRDHDEEIQRALREREKRTCSHSLYECVGCQVAREESEKRETISRTPRSTGGENET